MTTIALFGATGRTGRHVLDQALIAGHQVRALARRPEVLEPRAGLTVIGGDVTDPVAVGSVIEGADAVVSVFGHVKGSPPTVQTDGTRVIVEAMRLEGIVRIISLSGGGLRYPEKDRPKPADHIIRLLLTLIAPAVLSDATAHLQVLRDSGLDWTVVRGPRLTDGPRTGSYRVGWVGVDASTSISRADLAASILAQLDDLTYRHQLPFVSN